MKSRILSIALLLLLSGAHPAAALAGAPVDFPRNAAYLGSDGSITIVGYADMRGLMEAVGRLFTAAHPDFRFRYVPVETYAAPPALSSGVSALAPMGAEFTDTDVVAYRKLVGSYPVVFRVARDPTDPRAKSGPMGIFVNTDNPLDALTIDQVARIFARGSSRGEITKWGQLGLAGEWAGKAIAPCGTPFDVGIGAYMQQKFHGRPQAAGFIAINQSEDVLAYVASHPRAIGYAKLNLATPEVKLVAVSEGGGTPLFKGSREEIAQGRYPYDRQLLLYARQPIEPWVREYIRLAFSREGQAAIADNSPGYLPLTPREAAAEIEKLDL